MKKKLKINKGYITQKMGNKTTIFAGEESILYTLNETGSYIFQGVKLGWDKQEIARGLMEDFDVTKEDALKDIDSFIKNLQKKKVII